MRRILEAFLLVSLHEMISNVNAGGGGGGWGVNLRVPATQAEMRGVALLRDRGAGEVRAFAHLLPTSGRVHLLNDRDLVARLGSFP